MSKGTDSKREAKKKPVKTSKAILFGMVIVWTR
jgi:hypothetical protein